MTATERIYQKWLEAKDKKQKRALGGELAAICIKACRAGRLSPPYERHQDDSGRAFWRGGIRALSAWVYCWVQEELQREIPLRDRARYIGRRCKFALIDKIRAYKRRKRDADLRDRSVPDQAEIKRMRLEMVRELAEAGLPSGIKLAQDRQLLIQLMDAYPKRRSNISIARQKNVTEGAIRKRRKRIGAICFERAEGKYQLGVFLRELGLKGTKK
jgi:hypothetical protein